MDTSIRYAGFWRRATAFIIDILICNAGAFILGCIFGRTYALGIVIALLYFILQWSSARQATLGMHALDLKMVDYDHQRISVGRALIRYFAEFISIFTLGIGYLLIVFTKRKQALHDMIAKTYVIRT